MEGRQQRFSLRQIRRSFVLAVHLATPYSHRGDVFSLCSFIMYVAMYKWRNKQDAAASRWDSAGAWVDLNIHRSQWKGPCDWAWPEIPTVGAMATPVPHTRDNITWSTHMLRYSPVTGSYIFSHSICVLHVIGVTWPLWCWCWGSWTVRYSCKLSDSGTSRYVYI